LACHDALSIDLDPDVRQALASNLGAERALLARLANDPVLAVAAAALRNPFTPPEMVDEASESSVTERRAAAAANPMVGRDRASRLLRDEELAVALAAASNPRVPLT
jgi:hypothetical protein